MLPVMPILKEARDMAASSCFAAKCLILTNVVGVVSAAGVLPPDTSQPTTIRAFCTGGLVPLERDITVSTAGTIVARVAGSISTGRIDPKEVRVLSARMDASGFDAITAPARPSMPRADARLCALVRTSEAGTHGIAISRNTPVGLRRVLDDLLRIKVQPDPAGAGR
jgi:hypothetical protein